jgi:tetratricopeptide (TPR) repeat protein
MVESLYATGHWLLLQKRYDDAARVFRAMALTRPEDERAWLALGTCHEALDQPDVANELYLVAATVAAPAVRCAIARARMLRALDPRAARDAFEDAWHLALDHGEEELAALADHERNAS